MKIKSVIAVSILFSLFGTSISAKAEESASTSSASVAEEWRKKPPSLPAPREFKLPKIEKFKLSNGLSVELVEDHRVPFSTIALGVKAGSYVDPPNQAGLSTIVSDMLTEGTNKRSSKQIAEAIDFIGGAIAAQTGPDFTTVSASALSQYNERLLDTFADVILNPSFPEDELKLEKTNKIQELALNRSKPDFLAAERFAKIVFGNHPYSTVAPSASMVEKLKRQQLLDFHKQNFLPNEAQLVVVGDFKSDEMKSLVEKYFGEWKAGTIAKSKVPAQPKQTARKIYLIDRPDSVQSKIKLGNIGIKKSDPDFYALTVANQLLGGAATSRLFLNIRENKGYTYGAYSKMTPQKEPGSFSSEAEVRTEVTAAALQEFFYELERIRNLKPAEKELNDSKNYLVGSFQLGLETQSGLAQRLLEGSLYQLPDDYLETYGKKILAVGPDDVRRVARKYVDLDNIVVTVVGDSKKIKSELEYFAPLAVYDTEGNLENSGSKSAAAK
ncbi:MAG: insulinase family protein [Candidatus Obscuribacterales bacterium]|nr:insulinase family protein [Candidatus Obscuribacterales bacterium]